ncbi:prostate stem cell antigen-like [Cyprinodon tularosa]|uniref:prostate stem cell antigen-like n=1 Tax=Cyprinodon tularosa TaxID=77115 RepID=UPI0018E1F204|nr:prostate stem cell antigen-like [Cyprinodon tularosa]
MGKVLFSIVAVAASFVFVESLTCNGCSFALGHTCMIQSNDICSANVTDCYTASTAFAISSFNIIKLGCALDASGCNSTTNGTLLGIDYTYDVTCCAADFCNTLNLNSAPMTKMTSTTALCATILASLWGGSF